MQKFTGKILGTPVQLETKEKKRKVVHVTVGFMPEVKITGKLPEFDENSMSSIQLSFWDENFMAAIMAEKDSLSGKQITGYCDHVVKKDQYYNATGYVFVLDPKGKVSAPLVQVITKTTAPSAPVAPVA